MTRTIFKKRESSFTIWLGIMLVTATTVRIEEE